MPELDLLRRIARLAAGRSKHSLLLEGIGDDCAIMRPRGEEDLVFTTDFLLQGRHFNLDTHSAADVGHKALARSLSDLAAMGGEPVFCLVSLALPANLTSWWMDEFYAGLLALADRYATSLAGGDLSNFDKVCVDVMCCGWVPRGQAIRRSGAKAGDRIYVTGELGAAAESNWTRRPQPRIEAGLELRGFVTAGMDISDGLSLDLHRLCLASQAGAAINSARIPVARGATMEQALHGGEDYELLVTASFDQQLSSLFEIGVITSGEPGQILLDGQLLKPGGFDHFT